MTRENPDPVMHLEVKDGRAICGRRLPTAGFFTDDPIILAERAGSRCRSCWRVYSARNPGAVSE